GRGESARLDRRRPRGGRPICRRPELRERVGRARVRGGARRHGAGGTGAVRGGAAGGAAPPVTDLLLRAGEWSDVTPASAGWSLLSFRVEPAPFSGEASGEEVALVVLGGRCSVEASGERW